MARSPVSAPALAAHCPARALHCSAHDTRATHMEMKHWWCASGVLVLAALAAAAPEPEHGLQPAARSPRASDRESCRYLRGAWSECDPKTNSRSRKLTLKKGDPAACDPVKTIQKKCKKACRYEKSSWSECTGAGEMSRTDVLKPNSDPSCDKSRRLTKKCNKNKQPKNNKDKGRRNRQ